MKRLVRRGALVYGANHLVQPCGSAGATVRTPGTTPNQAVGVFQRTAKGFGFVRPTTELPAGTAAAGPDARPPDIYIPRKWTGDAASGDVVLVRLHRRRAGGQGPRGEIVEVLQRQTRQFVGTYFQSGRAGYVAVDGTLFAQPIAVGDPGAKGAGRDDKVVFEMVRFPSPVQDGEGVIVEVLGPRGKPGVDTLSIIREFNLPDAFAEDALDEARREAEKFDESIPPAGST